VRFADGVGSIVYMSEPRPNLVYVFADQLRLRSCGYAGDPFAQTPHIDRFAAESINFSNAVVASPVCTAYRATLLTGVHSTSHGMVINELRIHPNQRCLGHILTDAGYQTAYIGKWHLWANELGNHYDAKNSFVPPGPYRLGFDGEWKAYNFHHENYGTYYHEDTPEKRFYGEGVYEPEAQTDFAIDFIRRAFSNSSSQPFALILSWGPPHDPWGPDNAPARFWDRFSEESFPHPPNYRAENDEPYTDAWARLSEGERASLPSWRRGYYAQTASIDEQFGRLLDALDAAGVAENTLVIFTSDHGEMMGAHGRRAKNIFYDEACRVPFLLRHSRSNIVGGRVSDVCLSSVDILPTICGLLELEPPPGIEGMDLSPWAWGQTGPEPEAVLLQGTGAVAIWEDGHEWRALRDKRFTYAVYRVDGRELLFDNVADPYQIHDLSNAPSHVDMMARFRVMLRDRMAAINDNFAASTWYRAHWTDGNRNILRSATREYGPMPPIPD
jgi:arylsulfatase A-like enzyme